MEKNEHKSIKQIQTENQGHLIFSNIIQDKKIKLDQKLFIFAIVDIVVQYGEHDKNY